MDRLWAVSGKAFVAMCSANCDRGGGIFDYGFTIRLHHLSVDTGLYGGALYVHIMNKQALCVPPCDATGKYRILP